MQIRIASFVGTNELKRLSFKNNSLETIEEFSFSESVELEEIGPAWENYVDKVRAFIDVSHHLPGVDVKKIGIKNKQDSVLTQTKKTATLHRTRKGGLDKKGENVGRFKPQGKNPYGQSQIKGKTFSYGD